MTKNEIPKPLHKDFAVGENDAILYQYLGKNGICKECGQYHGFTPKFDDIKTSIDSIPVLLEKLQRLEQLEQMEVRSIE